MSKSGDLKTELLAVKAASHDDMLHAEKVVAWARSHKKSALHSEFIWDNDRAAHEFRIWQARRLIQIHVVAVDGAPQLVSLSFDRPNGGGYRAITDVLKDGDLSRRMFNDALQELGRVQERFGRVKELTKVWVEVERVRAKKRKAAKSVAAGAAA